MKKFITIITPTYNRKKELNVLYENLKKQSNLAFTWLIVNDGSVDKTDILVKKMIRDDILDIKYIKKENGGKHTALNVAFDNLKTDMFIVVDSDDYLTNDAIETIYEYYKNYKGLAGFVLLKGYRDNKPITVKFKSDEFIGNYVDDIINKQPSGDRVEVFYTKILKNNRFPSFPNEKFIGEGYFWCKISKNSKMLFSNKIIYICEYLENGLTKQGRKLRINNPLGGITHANEYLDKRYSFKLRVKNSMLYMIYYRFAKDKGLNPKKLPNSFIKYVCFIPSYIIYIYWNRKYNN